MRSRATYTMQQLLSLVCQFVHTYLTIYNIPSGLSLFFLPGQYQKSTHTLSLCEREVPYAEKMLCACGFSTGDSVSSALYRSKRKSAGVFHWRVLHSHTFS